MEIGTHDIRRDIVYDWRSFIGDEFMPVLGTPQDMACFCILVVAFGVAMSHLFGALGGREYRGFIPFGVLVFWHMMSAAMITGIWFLHYRSGFRF